ncbi:MAG: hypothetical protein K0U98_20450 [Deltaproteobacteria bacterium]|nr:hypothetical protein [Deltaproteobacteria bacterium]
MSTLPLKRRVLLSWAGLVSVLMLLSGGAIQGQPVSGVFELRPGVWIDSQNEKAFLMAPEGGIDCISLSDGAVLWQSSQALKPLALQASNLLAQVASSRPGSLNLAILSTDSGELTRSLTVDVSTEAMPSVDDQLGATFQVRTELGETGVTLAWSSSSRVVQGMPTDLAAARPQVREGAVLVNLASGALSEIAISRRLKEPQRPLLEGDQRQSGLVEGRQFLSADGQNISVSQRVTEGASLKEYRWSIYSRSGRHLGDLETFASYSPFTVSANNLIFETRPFARRGNDGEMEQEPLKIRAVSLSNGVELWQAEVRDTAYRGPYPP